MAWRPLSGHRAPEPSGRLAMKSLLLTVALGLVAFGVWQSFGRGAPPIRPTLLSPTPVPPGDPVSTPPAGGGLLQGLAPDGALGPAGRPPKAVPEALVTPDNHGKPPPKAFPFATRTRLPDAREVVPAARAPVAVVPPLQPEPEDLSTESAAPAAAPLPRAPSDAELRAAQARISQVIADFDASFQSLRAGGGLQ